jgi:hypothetical protein
MVAEATLEKFLQKAVNGRVRFRLWLAQCGLSSFGLMQISREQTATLMKNSLLRSYLRVLQINVSSTWQENLPPPKQARRQLEGS